MADTKHNAQHNAAADKRAKAKNERGEVKTDRLTKNESNGTGFADDRYSQSKSSRPEVTDHHDQEAGTSPPPQDMGVDKNSGKPIEQTGDPEAHASSARKSR